jgi:hypothetical protein
VGEGLHGITKVFSGVEDLVILHEIYGDRKSLVSVLDRVNVKVIDSEYYMYVDDADCSIVIGLNHLTNADQRTLYLDIIHELVHVKQFLDGKDIYDERYGYVDRQTEIEAYQVVIDEARKLRMNDEEIMEYLKVDWVSKDELRRLADQLGVSSGS